MDPMGKNWVKGLQLQNSVIYAKQNELNNMNSDTSDP